MEVVTITSEAFQLLQKNIIEINEKIDITFKKQYLEDSWLDISQVCGILNVTKRCLQNYRDNKILPYSQISGKIYFKAGDIDSHLKSNYHPLPEK